MRAALAAFGAFGTGCGDEGAAPSPDAARPADADVTVDAAPPRERVTSRVPLQPGELVEGVMHGGAADAAILRLVAPTPTLDWNIHSHATGHAETVIEQLGQRTVDYRFVPSGDGDWYLLLRNGGTVAMDVDVDVGLYGAMTWVWQ